MTREESVLLGVATSISDGTAIDWDVIGRQLQGTNTVLSQLEVLAGVARLHRGATTPLGPQDSAGRMGLDDPGAKLSAPDAPAARAREDAPLGRWGHLERRELVGAGAFGIVYRAWDTTLGREVALKLLKPPRQPGEPDVKEATRVDLREARLLASLRHPNIVTVYGAEHHDGGAGLWMEFIRGRTLEEILAEHGPFGSREAALIGLDLCRALAAVHRAGLVHRDIKSHNVMREDGGRIVLMDFGVAGKPHADPTTSVHTIAGSPHYMAPEVIAGAGARPQSDIYGLGVLLYHLVTGEYPTAADGSMELRRSRVEPRLLRDARPDLQEPFVRVIEKALAFDPTERYATVGEMELALTSALGLDVQPSAPVFGPLVSTSVQAPQRLPRRRVAFLAAALAVALVGAWVVLRALQGRSTGDASTQLHAVQAPAARAPVGTELQSPSEPATAYTVEATFQRHRGESFEPLPPGSRVALGDHLCLDFKASVPTYVYIIDEDERGEAWLLFPLPGLELRNPLEPGELHRLPGKRAGKPFEWTVTSVGGREHLLVVASPNRLTEFEADMLALPKAGSEGYAQLSDRARRHLRGIGGLEEGSGKGGAAASDRLFDMAARLGSRSEQVKGVWVRQVDLENPAP
jgi:serine/threonine-protein kinase